MESSPLEPRHTKGLSLMSFVLGSLSTLVLTFILLMWLSTYYERGRDDAVRANLESIATQARIYRGIGGSYGVTTDDFCSSAVFVDPTIQAALTAVRLANGYGVTRCSAVGEAFSVIAARPTRGFYSPPEPYWCADSSGAVCASAGEFVGEHKQCACTL